MTTKAKRNRGERLTFAKTAAEVQQSQHFAALKAKYQVTQYEDSSPTSYLYKILVRLETGTPLQQSDVNWLKKRGLDGSIAIAQEKHFAALKSKYDVPEYRNFSPASDLYAILQKLESSERLEPTDVAWLTEHQLFYRFGKIAQTYHQIEALFYEQEFQRTKSLWHLPSASSHWRSAGQSQRALKLTDAVNWERVKDKKLRSALLTTRGGAFRDIQELDEAQRCARQAITYQPQSHHPYTLMGAICYERGEYYEGDRWFDEAIKRGATPKDQDAEIKRVVRETRDDLKRRQVVDYLLQKDSMRYAWAKSFLLKYQNNRL